MIRVSNETEQRLKSISDGRSIGATVEMCLNALENMAADEEKKENSGAWARLATHIDERFDELKTLITDSLVDAVDSGRAPGGKLGEKEWVPWEQMSYIIFTHEDDDPAWIIPEASVFQFKNGDPTAYAYYVKDNVIFMESVGRPEPLIKVTTEIREAIDERKTYD